MTVDSKTLYIDYRVDKMWDNTQYLEIRKNSNGTYTWHNPRTTFTKEGDTVVFNNSEYDAWDFWTHISYHIDDFDQSISTPTNFSLDFYPAGAQGYGVPKLSWNNSDSFAEYQLERSFTGLFDEPDRKIYEGSQKSYIDYEVRIHPNPNMNTEAAYYRVRTILEQMKQKPDSDIPDEISNFTNTLDTDYWILLKLSADNLSPQLLTDFLLLPNYPNPFNAGTEIPLQLHRDSEVTLTIFDILGRQVATLHRGWLSSGQHVFHWDGSNGNDLSVSSGHYFLILKSPKHSSVRKLNLVK